MPLWHTALIPPEDSSSLTGSNLGWAECKCYSSEGKGFPTGNVTALRGEVPWQSGAWEYHKVTPHSKPHRRDFLRETQEGGCLRSVKKQQLSRREILCSVSWCVWRLSRVAWDWRELMV